MTLRKLVYRPIAYAYLPGDIKFIYLNLNTIRRRGWATFHSVRHQFIQNISGDWYFADELEGLSI